MPYLFVPGLERPISESGLPWDGPTEVSCTSNGMPGMRPSSWRGWKTRPWIARLSGTISRPSGGTGFADAWISSLRASRASRTPVLGRGMPTLTNGLSGPALCVWSAMSSPRSSSLRTCQDSSSIPKGSSTRWKSWVSSGLRRYVKPPHGPARHIFGSESISCVPTPTASRYGSGQNGNPGDSRTCYSGRRAPSLETLVNVVPTPTAGDAKGSGAAGLSTTSGRHSGMTLTDAVTGASTAGRTGKLNPRFCEWLMGLPIGWTSFER